jgi:hypothetical protein
MMLTNLAGRLLFPHSFTQDYILQVILALKTMEFFQLTHFPAD